MRPDLPMIVQLTWTIINIIIILHFWLGATMKKNQPKKVCQIKMLFTNYPNKSSIGIESFFNRIWCFLVLWTAHFSPRFLFCQTDVNSVHDFRLRFGTFGKRRCSFSRQWLMHASLKYHNLVDSVSFYLHGIFFRSHF